MKIALGQSSKWEGLSLMKSAFNMLAFEQFALLKMKQLPSIKFLLQEKKISTQIRLLL